MAGLPSVVVSFQAKGIEAIRRSQKGVVALILLDDKSIGVHEITNITAIPTDITVKNKEQIEMAFRGYINPPKKVIVSIIAKEGLIEDGLKTLGIIKFDYLALSPDFKAADVKKVESWIKSERLNDHLVKAVLPNSSSDSEAIVNLTTAWVKTPGGEENAPDIEYKTPELCSRIAGLIAGTPRNIASTYANLPEMIEVEPKTKEELDAAVNAGEFVLFYDGEKVKVGRGVNSLVTTTTDKSKDFKKIKIIEIMDMITEDIRITSQDSYIGKYENSYDNKCLLIVAIKGYLEELERDGILEREKSIVEIDMEAQEAYLKKQGIETEGMSEQELKTANTGSFVFIRAAVSILDAIEDIEIKIAI